MSKRARKARSRLTVKVLEGALESKGGEGKVVNGGESTTVQVGNDSEYHVEEVENPVPEEPEKKETHLMKEPACLAA